MNPETFYRDTEMCRVCPRTGNLKNLYHPSNETVLNNLNLIVYIENEEETLLPKFICQICQTALQQFIDFKRQCEERDKELREIIGSAKQNVKTESLDVSDNEEINGYKTYEPQVNVEIESLDIIENFQSLLETREDANVNESETASSHEAKATQCTAETCSDHVVSEHGSGSKRSIIDSGTKRSSPRELKGSFPCELCNLTFTLKSNLGKHVRLFHKTPDSKTDKKAKDKARVRTKLSFICSYCGKSLQTRTNLNWHLRIHTNEKPHECDVCNRMFRTPVTLAAHKLIHTNEKPYTCGICNAAFRQSAHLKTHQLRHQDEKKFSCKICDMSTKFKYNLDTHMRDVHLAAKKNYQCEICQEKMYSKTKLTNHMLTHN